MSPVDILSHTNPSYTPTHFLKTQFNTTLPSTPSSSKWPLSLMSRHQNTLPKSPSSHTCHTIRPSHSSCFYHPNDIPLLDLRQLVRYPSTHTNTHTHTHIYIYVCVCVCVCVCVWVQSFQIVYATERFRTQKNLWPAVIGSGEAQTLKQADIFFKDMMSICAVH